MLECGAASSQTPAPMSTKTTKQQKKRKEDEIHIPAAHDWRTSDEDEINRRRLRAQSGQFRIANTDARHPVFSEFRVESGSGLTYRVEIRDVLGRQFACDCVDFRTNGLGTCKHIEAVLLHLDARLKGLFKSAIKHGSDRLDIVPDRSRDTLRLVGDKKRAPRWTGS